MSFLEQAPTGQLQPFLTSLAIGLLIGLERERKTDAKAGLRTFGLVAMLGTLCAMLAKESASGWIVALGLITVGGMMIAALALDPPDDGDPGTTSVVALMVTYALGAVIWFGYAELAVMLGVGTTALLYFKTELHGFSQRLTHKDLISILQFGVLSFVILPILPDRNFGPYGAFNPHQIWWMVVLISGVSLAGYAALRLVGGRHGAAMVGFFGGLVSSTATTMVFARHARADEKMIRTATVVILLANLMVTLRLGLVSALLAPSLILPLAAVLGAGLVLGLGVTLAQWRSLGAQDHLPTPDVSNPTEIRAALSFGALYGVVLGLAAWLQDLAGDRGLYLVALASGLTDVDAITLSTLRLYNLQKLQSGTAVMAIALAFLSNLGFKAGLLMVIGGASIARRVLPGLVAIGLGMGIALLATA